MKSENAARLECKICNSNINNNNKNKILLSPGAKKIIEENKISEDQLPFIFKDSKRPFLNEDDVLNWLKLPKGIIYGASNSAKQILEIINNKKFTLISIFLFLYVVLNFLDGERGLISYYEKQKTIEQLFQEEKSLVMQLDVVEKKNKLLTDIIDTDYLEILYRKKFMVGKSNEHIYKNN